MWLRCTPYSFLIIYAPRAPCQVFMTSKSLTASPLITGRRTARQQDPRRRLESNYTADYATDSIWADGTEVETWRSEPDINGGRRIEPPAASGCRCHFHIFAFSGLGQDWRSIAASGSTSNPALCRRFSTSPLLRSRYPIPISAHQRAAARSRGIYCGREGPAGRALAGITP
jgi:hypothetical protein